MDDKSTTYTLRRLDSAIQRFTKVLTIDLDILAKHRSYMLQLLESNDWKSLHREQIHTDRTVAQLKSYMKQLEVLRSQVSEDDKVIFDKKVSQIRERAVRDIQHLLLLYSTSQHRVLDGQHNVSSSKYDENSRSFCLNSSTSHDINNSLTHNDTCDMTSLSTHRTISPYGDDADDDDDDYVGEVKQLQLQATLNTDYTTQPHHPHLNPEQPYCSATSSSEGNMDPVTQQSWNHLHQSLEDFNSLMSTFATAVHDQQQHIDDIESHVTNAQESVHEGAVNIVKTSRLKAAMFPTLGALVGGACGGPVGFVIGLKAGGAVALGGGLLGFAGGRYLKNNKNANAEVDEQKLSSTK